MFDQAEKMPDTKNLDLQLVVKLVEAKDLRLHKESPPPSSSSIQKKSSSNVMKPPNAMAIVKVGRNRRRSKVVNRSDTPRWNETFTFKLGPNRVRISPPLVRISLWDRSDRLGQRRFLGLLEVPLMDLLPSGDESFLFDEDTQEVWYSLESRNHRTVASGAISLQIGWRYDKTVDIMEFRLFKSLAGRQQDLVIATPVLKEAQILEAEEDEDEEADLEFDNLSLTHYAYPSAAESTESRSDRAVERLSESMDSLGLEIQSPIASDSVFGHHLGLLTVEIVRASNLPKNRSLLPGRFDMDPFVVCTLSMKSFKTRFIRHTLQPFWNEVMFFDISQQSLAYAIKFSVYDHDKLSQNDYVGAYEVMTSDIVSLFVPGKLDGLAGDRVERDYPLVLKKDTGEPSTLHVKFCFRSYAGLRRQFVKAQIERFMNDVTEEISAFELEAMLDALDVSNATQISQDILKKKYISLPMPELLDEFEKYVIEDGAIDFAITKCPYCRVTFRPKRKNSVAIVSGCDILTHLSLCNTSQDKLDTFINGGYLTESYARRKWFTKIASYVSFGRYALGETNGNILVFDRKTGRMMEEKIPSYIRLGIRLLYQSRAYRSVVETKRLKNILRNMSIRQGKKFDDPSSRKQILHFIKFHNININDIAWKVPFFEDDEDRGKQLEMAALTNEYINENFANFNEFFYRKLTAAARPLASPSNPRVITSPGDCRLNVFADISTAQKFWIKGSAFSLTSLLQDETLAKTFEKGSIAICRLAPQDYHRYHHSVDGVVKKIYTIPGEYYTVNPMAIRESFLSVFTENCRKVVVVESEFFGTVAYVCVGAMMVGSIILTSKEGQHVKRMDELGYFAFGGSSILVLFPPNKGIVWDADIVDKSHKSIETLVEVGTSIGQLIN